MNTGRWFSAASGGFWDRFSSDGSLFLRQLGSFPLSRPERWAPPEYSETWGGELVPRLPRHTPREGPKLTQKQGAIRRKAVPESTTCGGEPSPSIHRRSALTSD